MKVVYTEEALRNFDDINEILYIHHSAREA